MPSNASGHENALPIPVLFSVVQLVPPVSTETHHPVQKAFNPNMFLFIACAIFDSGAPSVLRRSYRQRTPLVCLRPHDSSHENLKYSLHDATTKNAVLSLQSTFPAKVEPGTTDLDLVLDARWRQDYLTPTTSNTHPGRMGASEAGEPRSTTRNAETVLDHALHTLTNIPTLLRET